MNAQPQSNNQIDASEEDDFEFFADRHALALAKSQEARISIDTGIDTDTKIIGQHTVDADTVGMRLDKAAALVFAEHSRVQLQNWIASGELTVNGDCKKSKHRLSLGDKLVLNATLQEHGDDLPEELPIDVVYEDDNVVVVNKPVGMVVHPGAGNWTGTLVNALLFHYPTLAPLPRAGLVHRIDKDTSGLLMIAKTKSAQLHLTAQLKDKSLYRHYQCVVAGDAQYLSRHRIIDEPIARHPTARTKMSVQPHGKDAQTHIANITALNDSHSLLDVELKTGRTHQIRVHLSHIGCPLVGDAVYGTRNQLRAGLTDAQRQAVKDFPRQALHAYELGFIHPHSGEQIRVTAPLPQDMQALIDALKDDALKD